jgi:hypothetical protein
VTGYPLENTTSGLLGLARVRGGAEVCVLPPAPGALSRTKLATFDAETESLRAKGYL